MKYNRKYLIFAVLRIRKEAKSQILENSARVAERSDYPLLRLSTTRKKIVFPI